MLLSPVEHGALSRFWDHVPLLRPQLWLQRGDALSRLTPDEPLPANEAVLAALRAWPEVSVEPNAPLLLRDSKGRLWRLRGCAAFDGCRLWQAQSLDQSRALLFDELRTALGRVLAGPVRHELCGPLQVLAFNADIAARLAQAGPGDARVAASLEGIKRGVSDLLQRQTATVALWLAGPPECAMPAVLREVIDDALALLQGYLGAMGAPLQRADLSGLDGILLPGLAQNARIGWLALLLMAGKRASRTRGESRGLRLSVARQPDLILELDGEADAAALGPGFAALGDEATVATAAVLLEEAGLELLPQDGRKIRLKVHALRQEGRMESGSGVASRRSPG